MELQACQPHLDPWKDVGAANLGNAFQAHKGEENHQEKSAWIHQGAVMPDKPENLLQ